MSKISPILALAGVLYLAYFLRRAAGRLAPQIALAPVVFLATRLPVLVTWALGTIGAFVTLLSGMRDKGLDTPGNQLMALGISLLSGGGIAVLVVGPVFFVARLFAKVPEVPLEPGEEPLFERPANHFLGGEGRGGRLLVTTRRLTFRPHRFNVQLAPWSLPLDALARAEVSGDRLLVVHAKDGSPPAWLVAMGPRKLAAQLEALARTPEHARDAEVGAGT